MKRHVRILHLALLGWIALQANELSAQVLPPSSRTPRLTISIPGLSVTPGSMDFGQVMLPGYADRSFTVSNIAAGTLNGTAWTSSPFEVLSGASFSIPSGQSQTVTIRFAPTTPGSSTGTVNFSGGSATTTRNVTGVAFSPLSVTPSTQDFGSVLFGTSADRTFTIQNIGSEILSGTASVDAPFSIVGVASYSLSPGQSATITVRFTPKSIGTVGGTLTLTGATGATAGVTGTGVTGPILSITPVTQDFGSVAIRSVVDLTFAVTNTGTGVTVLSGMASTDPPFSIAGGAAYSLSAGESQTVTVRFCPTQPGLARGSIRFTGAAGAAATLNGTGVGARRAVPYALSDKGSMTLNSASAVGDLTVGYGTIRPGTNQGPVSGVEVFTLRTNGVTVTETGVPAAPLLKKGRIYAEESGPVQTGLAIANPNDENAAITFFFTDANGNEAGSGNITIPANGQVARFLDQPPFNARGNFRGTMTYSSSVPLGVTALRGLTNARGEFLISTLPVIDPSNLAIASVLPHFADSGGWTTQVVLINPGDSALTGSIAFVKPNGAPQSITAAGQTNTTFAYSIAPKSSFRLATEGTGSTVLTGSIQIVPSRSSSLPVPFAVFSYAHDGITVSEAAVAPEPLSGPRLYVESSGTPGETGSTQSGIAIANRDSFSSSITLELTDLDGTTIASRAIVLAGYAQSAKFLTELFPGLTGTTQGVLSVYTAGASVSVVGLRGRYNERGDFLITTTPASDSLDDSGPAPLQVFPHLVTGGGYATQITVFSRRTGRSSAGNLEFFRTDGTQLPLQFDGFADLSVSKSDLGTVTSDSGGIDCGTYCTGSFPLGTSVTLTATPDPGYVLTGWSGACSNTACTIRLDANTLVTANFDTGASAASGNTRVLQVFKGTAGAQTSSTTVGHGSVSSVPESILCGGLCGGHFIENSVVRLTAQPDKGQTFVGWADACAGSATNPTCTLIMDGDKRVTATFSQPKSGEGGPIFGGTTGLMIHVQDFPSVTQLAGTVTTKPESKGCTNRDVNGCILEFALGLPVVMTATPASGWVFKGWQVYPPSSPAYQNDWPGKDCANSTDPCTVLGWFLAAGGYVSARFDAISTGPPPPPVCRTADATISSSGPYGLLTWVSIQGITAFFVAPTDIVRIHDVPIGVYTVVVATTGRGLQSARLTVTCNPVNAVVFRAG